MADDGDESFVDAARGGGVPRDGGVPLLPLTWCPPQLSEQGARVVRSRVWRGARLCAHTRARVVGVGVGGCREGVWWGWEWGGAGCREGAWQPSHFQSELRTSPSPSPSPPISHPKAHRFSHYKRLLLLAVILCKLP